VSLGGSTKKGSTLSTGMLAIAGIVAKFPVYNSRDQIDGPVAVE
jgi:hypothetical protein